MFAGSVIITKMLKSVYTTIQIATVGFRHSYSDGNHKNYLMTKKLSNTIIKQILVSGDSMQDFDKTEANNLVVCISWGCHVS